jgi:hypothetical protein
VQRVVWWIRPKCQWQLVDKIICNGSVLVTALLQLLLFVFQAPDGTSRTCLLLNLFAMVQQLQGWQVGPTQDSCIQEGWLLSDIHGSCLIQQRDTGHLHTGNSRALISILSHHNIDP